MFWLEPWRFILQALYQITQKQCLPQLSYLCLVSWAVLVSCFSDYMCNCYSLGTRFHTPAPYFMTAITHAAKSNFTYKTYTSWVEMYWQQKPVWKCHWVLLGTRLFGVNIGGIHYPSSTRTQVAFGQWEFTAVCFLLCPALHCCDEQLSCCKQPGIFLQSLQQYFPVYLLYVSPVLHCKITLTALMGHLLFPVSLILPWALASRLTCWMMEDCNLISLGCSQCLCRLFSLC